MDKCAPVAKKELFYIWPFGLGAWLAGVVFIDRLNSKKAHQQLVHASKLMKTHKVPNFITIWYSEIYCWFSIAECAVLYCCLKIFILELYFCHL